MNDEQIIGLYCARDEAALTQTARRYGRYLGVIAQNILHSREDSEECVNDTYLRAWNTIPPNAPLRLDYYLGKITRALAIDRLRQKTSRKRGVASLVPLDELAEVVSDSDTTEETVDRNLLAAAITEYLRGCTKDARDIFLCRYYFCDSVKSIAAAQGISEAKVKSSLFHTRNGLRVYLEKEGFFHEA